MENKNTFDLSVCITSFNTKDLLKNCLESVFKNKENLKLEVLVVDNGSKDKTPQMVERLFPKVKLIKNSKNFLVTHSHNQNLKRAKGRYFLLLCDNTIIPPKTLKNTVNFLNTHKDIGVLTCKTLNEKGQTQMTCTSIPHPLIEFFEISLIGKFIRKILKNKEIEKKIGRYRYINWKRNKDKEVEVAGAAFFMGRKEVLKKIGFFDKRLLQFYQEPDFCQRAKKVGFKNYFLNGAGVIHCSNSAISQIPLFKRYLISQHDMLAYYRKYFGPRWAIFLWVALRPNWIYWHLVTLK